MREQVIDTVVLSVMLCTMVVGLMSLTLGIVFRAFEAPVCLEDQVIVGTGEFNEGRWTAYICGPALDDLK